MTLIKHFVLAALALLIAPFLPKHMRKIILITSLHIQLARQNVCRALTTQQLNAVMGGLATCPDALKAPWVLFPNAIDGDKLRQLLNTTALVNQPNEVNYYRFSAQLSEITPKILRYDSVEMSKDVERLLRGSMATA